SAYLPPCRPRLTGEQAPKLEPPFAPRSLLHSHTASITPSPTSSQHAASNGAQHVVLDTTALTALDSLPTIAGRGNDTFLVNKDIATFLEDDLDLKRLNDIHAHLWMAGRPMRARPLHRYKMYGYEVLGTQQMDLHLLRFSNKLLVKPLPEYLLDASFWKERLCVDKELHESATGWLLSYVWLIVSPLDLKLAHDNLLIPAAVTWQWWRAFVTSFVDRVDINTLYQVNKRYHFGDLRLSRINTIYRTRFFATHFVRGYLYGYNRYVVFFERNFSWILILFVFLSLVLSAMQVGTALDELNGSTAFMNGTYGVVVLSMVSVAAVLGVVGLFFVGVFMFNMVTAIRHAASKGKERRRAKKE
ncbi:uncharacterized protein M421DRAFT_45562, partial [Didymella exigua CBS 183.55]